MEKPKIPAIVQVTIAGAVVAAAIVSVLIAPMNNIAAEGRLIVGEREQIRITSSNGRTVEALATIDTGATSSSMDQSVAEKLALDLSEAETVTVRSALGREERPVVPVAVQIAAVAKPATVTVTDRSDFDTPVLIGRDELGGMAVNLGQELLTTPGSPDPPSALATLLSVRAAEFDPGSLLALMPLAAVLVVLARNVVGVTTLGTFSPILITFGFLQVGFIPALVLTVAMLAVGILVEPLLRRQRLPRVGRVAVVIGIMSIFLLALESAIGLSGSADSWGAAFPLVVTAVIVERLWEEWELEGGSAAIIAAAQTLALALVVLPILVSPPVRWLAEQVPLPVAVASVIWAWIAGTYRGLRLSELMRFSFAHDRRATT